jgi:hypothetical protein
MAEEVLCLIYMKNPLKEQLMSVCDTLLKEMYDA